jgi:DNA-binding GntR family transcriptional regulator
MPTPATSTSSDRDSLSDRAYAALKSDLLAGRLPPGTRVVLRQVADELGISLTPVRDAVNRLIAEKILEHGGLGQSGGAIVPLLDADEFDQLMTVRLSLEPLAAAAAAARATRQGLAAVAAELAEMKRSVKEDRTDQYLQAHYQFHFRIYAMCRMPIVQDVIESAWLRCGPTLTLALPEYIPRLKRYQSHVDTLAALRKGDGEGAAGAIRADIESARQDIRALLQQAHPAR